MRTLEPRVAKYHGSETSKYVVEGLRVNGKRTRKFFRKQRVAEAWLRKTMAHVRKAGSGEVANPNRERVARAATVKVAEMPEWKTNALRHSFASYHIAHFQDAPKTAYQLGQSSPEMLAEHYDAVVDPEPAAEWWQVMPPADYSNVVSFNAKAVS